MLLDTSGLLHFLDRKSPEHSHARDYFSAADMWLTHDLVLAELIALAPKAWPAPKGRLRVSG